MPGSMTSLAAETLALKGLGFLASSPEDMERFMALSGIGPAHLRARADDPEFLAAVIDFLLANETLLIAFCEAEALDARVLHMMRQVLDGA